MLVPSRRAHRALSSDNSFVPIGQIPGEISKDFYRDAPQFLGCMTEWWLLGLMGMDVLLVPTHRAYRILSSDNLFVLTRGFSAEIYYVSFLLAQARAVANPSEWVGEEREWWESGVPLICSRGRWDDVVKVEKVETVNLQDRIRRQCWGSWWRLLSWWGRWRRQRCVAETAELTYDGDGKLAQTAQLQQPRWMRWWIKLWMTKTLGLERQ